MNYILKAVVSVTNTVNATGKALTVSLTVCPKTGKLFTTYIPYLNKRLFNLLVFAST